MPKGNYTYDYPRPMVTVDSVVFTLRDGRLEVLLIQRAHDPWKGMWATPGGFLDMDEDLETAAARELAEETGITSIPLCQFHTFGQVARDPRGRVITVAYLGVADHRAVRPRADDDAAAVAWHPVSALPPLAADHHDIIATAVRFLRERLAAEGPACLVVHGAIDVEALRDALSSC